MILWNKHTHHKKRLPRRFILPNGFTFVHVPTSCKTLFRLEIIIRSGVIHEENNQTGYGHFIEHLCAFFPSKEYPDALFNQQQMTRRGLRVNAYTEDSVVGYFIEGLCKHRDEALHVLMSSFLNPKCKIETYENEKQSILRELDGYINSPWYALSTAIQSLQYSGTNLENSIKHEKFITERHAPLKKLMDYRKKMYSFDRSVLILSSNDSDRQIKTLLKLLVQLYFPSILQQHSITRRVREPQYFPPIPHRPNQFTNLNKLYFFTKSSSAVDPESFKFEIHFRIPFNQFDEERVFILKFIQIILCNDMGSRLYRTLRSHVGGVYHITSECVFMPMIENYNFFTISSETVHDKLVDVHDHLMIEFETLYKDTTFTSDEIDQYTNFVQKLRDSYECSQTPFQESNRYKQSIVYGRPFLSSDEEFQKRIDILKHPDKIRAVVHQVFDISSMRFFYSGREPLLQKYTTDKHEIITFSETEK